MISLDDFGGLSTTATEREQSVAVVLLRAEFERLRLVIAHASIQQRKDFWGLLQAIAADDFADIAIDVEACRARTENLWVSIGNLTAEMSAWDTSLNVSLERIERRLDAIEFRQEQLERRTA